MLKFKLGYSIPCFLSIPSGVKVSIYKQRKLVIYGVAEQNIQNFIFQIRSLRRSNAYKLKGIRFWQEKIKLKLSKKTR